VRLIAWCALFVLGTIRCRLAALWCRFAFTDGYHWHVCRGRPWCRKVTLWDRRFELWMQQ
jgi:hypothetical protein